MYQSSGKLHEELFIPSRRDVDKKTNEGKLSVNKASEEGFKPEECLNRFNQLMSKKVGNTVRSWGVGFLPEEKITLEIRPDTEEEKSEMGSSHRNIIFPASSDFTKLAIELSKNCSVVFESK